MLVPLPFPFAHQGNEDALSFSDLMRPHDWYVVIEKSKDSTRCFCPQFHALQWYLQSSVQEFPLILFLEKLIAFLISYFPNPELSASLLPVSELSESCSFSLIKPSSLQPLFLSFMS